MIIQFDLVTGLFLVFLIPSIVFLCGFALAIDGRLDTYFQGDYTAKVVERNNKLLLENQELWEKIKESEQND